MSRTFRHWTPTYVVDRLKVFGSHRLHPEWPWLTAGMVRILETWLRPTDRGLEWGSGRSTLWLARRISLLVSIEHDPGWGEWVRTALSRSGLNNVEHHVITTREEYAAAGDGEFDFVLVDGMDGTRDHCALRSLYLLRGGGALIVDNCNWFLPNRSRSPNSVRTEPATPQWAEFREQVANWRCIWTTDGVTDTALWIKPAVNSAHSRTEHVATVEQCY